MLLDIKLNQIWQLNGTFHDYSFLVKKISSPYLTVNGRERNVTLTCTSIVYHNSQMLTSFLTGFEYYFSDKAIFNSMHLVLERQDDNCHSHNNEQLKHMKCKMCNIKNEYADPNQDDGTYICYNCRR